MKREGGAKMLVRGHPIAFQWPRKRRIAWLLVALGLMFTSAYSIFRWLGVVGAVSGWIGLPQYEAEIPKLQREGEVWWWLAIALPLVAALLLGLGKEETSPQIQHAGPTVVTYPAESKAEEWTAPIVRYFTRLVISVLGTLGFALCLFLVGFLFYKR